VNPKNNKVQPPWKAPREVALPSESTKGTPAPRTGGGSEREEGNATSPAAASPTMAPLPI